MKKLTAVIFIVITLIFFNSCSPENFMMDRDQRKAHKLIDSVLDAMEKEDAEELKSLFSQTTLNQMQSYEESAEDLFDYFNGSVISYDDGAGPYVSTEREDDFVFQLMESSFVVKTDACEYRCAMQFITEGQEQNIGITSLYIIKTADDVNLDCLYWGDAKFTPGIHLAIPNVFENN